MLDGKKKIANAVKRTRRGALEALATSSGLEPISRRN